MCSSDLSLKWNDPEMKAKKKRFIDVQFSWTHDLVIWWRINQNPEEAGSVKLQASEHKRPQSITAALWSRLVSSAASSPNMGLTTLVKRCSNFVTELKTIWKRKPVHIGAWDKNVCGRAFLQLNTSSLLTEELWMEEKRKLKRKNLRSVCFKSLKNNRVRCCSSSQKGTYLLEQSFQLIN